MKNSRLHKRPLAVPEGYFESLNARLSSIPRTQVEIHGDTGLRRHFRPWPVLAACAVASTLIATALFFGLGRSGVTESAVVTYEQLLYADLIPHTDPYSIYESSYSYPEDRPNMDDILQSLLNEGVSAETIRRYESEEHHY